MKNIFKHKKSTKLISSRGREKSTFQTIFVLTAVLLLAMPFITTFNEFLTSLVLRFNLYRIIEEFIVPWEARIVGATLLPFNFNIIANPEGLTVNNIAIRITWNCIGWQSFILLIITLVTGLQGGYSLVSRLECITIGLLGTFLVNIFRISLVVIFAYYFGNLPAVIFHDYFSNLLVIIWLFFFWWFCYTYVLEKS